MTDLDPKQVGREAAAKLNTDRELWREREGGYYANSIHVTEGGGIGINVGGLVIVKSLADWHALARMGGADYDPTTQPFDEPFTHYDPSAAPAPDGVWVSRDDLESISHEMRKDYNHDRHPSRAAEWARKVLAASPALDDGTVRVPRILTEEMIETARRISDGPDVTFQEHWDAMLAAAPSQPAGGEK